MLIKVTSINNKFLKRLAEHCTYLIIALILIPAFFYFELCIVLPSLVEEWTWQYFIHIFFILFFLVNIVGNMVYGMFTNTSIRGRMLDSNSNSQWTLCTICECFRPPRAWHCDICNICILKRDHHCTFFACCVGYFNHRYFMLFTFHIFIAMTYAFYYNIQFVSKFISWNHGLIILKFVFPLIGIVVDFGIENIYIFLLLLNVIVALFTGFLFFYHFNNVLKYRIVYEKNNNAKSYMHNNGWKFSIIEVFGTRWYLTWILPFIHSPLPGNGLDWDNKQN